LCQQIIDASIMQAVTRSAAMSPRRIEPRDLDGPIARAKARR